MADTSTAPPVLRFRNYAPRDAALAQHVAPLPVPSSEAADLASAAAAASAPAPADAPVLIVPKKANWDLKRDLAPKLERLSKLTQRAIGELVAARAAGGGGGGGGGAAASAPALDEVYRGPLDPALLARGKAEEKLDDE